MIPLLTAAAVGLLVSIFGTPYAIRFFRRREIGQFIQEEIAGMHGQSRERRQWVASSSCSPQSSGIWCHTSAPWLRQAASGSSSHR